MEDRIINIAKGTILEMIIFNAEKYRTKTNTWQEFLNYRHNVINYSTQIYDRMNCERDGMSDRLVNMFNSYSDNYYEAYFNSKYNNT